MYRRQWLLLMGFHLLWGGFLGWSLSRYGLGISTDSVHYLFAGLNLARGNGLISFDASPFLNWPPLYPLLIAALHALSGVSPFVAAHLIQFAAFVGTSLCLSILFLNIFPEDFLFAFLGNVLSQVGVAVWIAFGTVGSDYLHFFLVLLFIVLAGRYSERPASRLRIAMFLTGMLTMLDRYLGLAVVPVGMGLAFYVPAGRLRPRLGRALMMGLAALPAGLWLYLTSPLIGRRAPLDFADNFLTFSRAILEWVWWQPVPDGAAPLIVILWLLILAMLAIVFWMRRPPQRPSNTALLLLAYGASYTLTLFGAASRTYFNRLEGRFLLPIYVPLIVLLLLASRVLLRLAPGPAVGVRFLWRAAALGLLLLTSFGLLRNTLPRMLLSRTHGARTDNAFNTRAWRQNRALQYWMNHVPAGEYLLLSNYPDGLAFYTLHNVYSSPRRFSGPYGKVPFPLETYRASLFASGLEVYLIWVEPNEYGFLYTPEDLKAIARVEPLFQSRDGGVYRLFPRGDGRASGGVQ